MMKTLQNLATISVAAAALLLAARATAPTRPALQSAPLPKLPPARSVVTNPNTAPVDLTPHDGA